MGDREDAVRHVLATVPGSIRSVARETSVSETLLRLIRDGHRVATPEVSRAIVEALRRLGARYIDAADVLEEALNEEETP